MIPPIETPHNSSFLLIFRGKPIDWRGGQRDRGDREGRSLNTANVDDDDGGTERGPYLYDVRNGWGEGPRKEKQSQLIYVHDKGGGCPKIQIFVGRRMSIAPRDGDNSEIRFLPFVKVALESMGRASDETTVHRTRQTLSDRANSICRPHPSYLPLGKRAPGKEDDFGFADLQKSQITVPI